MPTALQDAWPIGTLCTTDGEDSYVSTSRFKAADTEAYTSWDIREGVTIGGEAGEIAFYKNMAYTTLFDRSTGDGAASGLDVYDTLDDYRNNGAFPTENNTGWAQATGGNWILDPSNDNGAGGGTSSNGTCDGGEACVFLDRITNLMWAQNNGTTYLWEAAVTYCEDLNYGSYTDWRLPTHKELLTAYVDGIWSLKAATKLNLPNGYTYSSTTRSSTAGLTDAWTINFPDGNVGWGDKGTISHLATCVR
jgi:hypothetical protein